MMESALTDATDGGVTASRPRRPLAGWLALVGTVIVTIGSFGPWLVFDLGSLSTSTSGTSGDGVITASIAILAAALLVFCLVGRLGRRFAWIVFALLLLEAIIGIADWVVQREDLGETVFLQIGWGLHAVAFGSVASAVFALVHVLSEAPRRTPPKRIDDGPALGMAVEAPLLDL